jgi:hypothetical protein
MWTERAPLFQVTIEMSSQESEMSLRVVLHLRLMTGIYVMERVYTLIQSGEFDAAGVKPNQ